MNKQLSKKFEQNLSLAAEHLEQINRLNFEKESAQNEVTTLKDRVDQLEFQVSELHEQIETKNEELERNTES